MFTEARKIQLQEEVLKVSNEATLLELEIVLNNSKKRKTNTENDIYIATIAQHHKLAIATRDRHFKEIDTIKVKNW